MKSVFLLLIAMIVAAPIASARFSERKLETAMASASKSGKLLAFVFYQDYALPNCPKCVMRTNANNAALKSAIARADVVVIDIKPKDANLDKLPEILGAKGRAPRIVVTDAQCKNIVAKLDGAPDRDKARQFKSTVHDARSDD
jgi:hypothetical protein